MDPFVEVKPMASSSGSHSGRGDGKATSASGNNKSSSSASSSASHPGHYANAHPDPQAIYPEGKHRPGGSPPPIAEPVRHPAQSPTAAASSSSSTPAPAPASAGSRSTSAAIAATYQKKSETVFLNVYDLHPYNSYLPMFGAYHTAVEIFGREYSFGFHSSDDTGVWSSAPKQVPNAVFREQLEVGNIYLTLNQFNLILTQLKNEWTGNKYHLLKRSQSGDREMESPLRNRSTATSEFLRFEFDSRSNSRGCSSRAHASLPHVVLAPLCASLVFSLWSIRL